jgi:GNAT superfamily N-acetyltransferase
MAFPMVNMALAPRSPVIVVRFRGSRSDLRPLFAHADDSPAAIDSYIEQGEVFVARRSGHIVGHVQLLRDGVGWEIKSVAVTEGERGRGIGTLLVRAALRRAFNTCAAYVRVATATADIANLRFYQRLGFRMDRVERDAFTPDRGYERRDVDGIPLRDRVWLSIDAGDDDVGDAVTPRGAP